MRKKIISKRAKVLTRDAFSGFLAILLFLSALATFSPASFACPDQVTQEAGQKSVSPSADEMARFPGTEAGKMAESFWLAFEKADAARLEEFFQGSLPAEKLQQMPAKERAQRLLGLRQKLGQELRLIFINSPSPEEVTIFLKNSDGEMFRLGLAFETQAQEFFLKALTVDEATPEDLAPPLPPLSFDQALQGIQQEIDKTVQEDRFSGVVLIARDFVPVFFKSYGLASKEFGVPNRIDTRFNLGSINKIFTKIAIAQLVEKGRLSLDDKLGKLLPDYPNLEAREKVMVRHLVNMTSGIGDFFGPEFQKTPKDFIRHNRDYLKLFATKPLAFEPGTKEMYSNGGYVVLGEIISAVSGMDYYDYVHRNIFEPAGMKNAAWLEADEVVENVAEGYTRRSEAGNENKGEDNPAMSSEKNQPAVIERKADQKQRPAGFINQQPPEKKDMEKNGKDWRRNIYTRPARGSAAGGGYATAEDLLRFIRALYESLLLSEAWTNWVITGIEPKPEKTEIQETAKPEGENNLGAEVNQEIENKLNPASTITSRPLTKLANFSHPDDIELEEAVNKREGGESVKGSTVPAFIKKATTERGSNFMSANPGSSEHSQAQALKEGAGRNLRPQNASAKKPTERSRWNLAIAGGAPGINAVLEFEAGSGYTVIVLSNYDPPAAIQTARMIRRFLQAVMVKE